MNLQFWIGLAVGLEIGLIINIFYMKYLAKKLRRELFHDDHPCCICSFIALD